MQFLWLALLVATSLAERAADGADVLAPIDIDGELGFPDTDVDDDEDISDTDDNEDEMLRRPLDIPKLDPGNLPITKVFTRAGLDAAANSAGCGNKPEWRSRMAAVHDLVAHTYILTLPRENKVNAATDAAERYVALLSSAASPTDLWLHAKLLESTKMSTASFPYQAFSAQANP
jgi:hypothetical protein